MAYEKSNGEYGPFPLQQSAEEATLSVLTHKLHAGMGEELAGKRRKVGVHVGKTKGLQRGKRYREARTSVPSSRSALNLSICGGGLLPEAVVICTNVCSSDCTLLANSSHACKTSDHRDHRANRSVICAEPTKTMRW